MKSLEAFPICRAYASPSRIAPLRPTRLSWNSIVAARENVYLLLVAIAPVHGEFEGSALVLSSDGPVVLQGVEAPGEEIIELRLHQ